MKANPDPAEEVISELRREKSNQTTAELKTREGV